MTANAAILRKDSIYAPVYDELASKLKCLDSFELWASSSRPRFDEWERRREGHAALVIRDSLVKEFESFLDLCERYAHAQRCLFDRQRALFPERHVDVDDYGVARVLAEKMLVAEHESDEIVLEYLRHQRPSTPDPVDYWTADRLASARAEIESLDEWRSVRRLHSEYVAELKALHAEMGRRIQGIIHKFRRPGSTL